MCKYCKRSQSNRSPRGSTNLSPIFKGVFLQVFFLKRKKKEKKKGCTKQGEPFLEMPFFVDRESIFKTINAIKEHHVHQSRYLILAPHLNLIKYNLYERTAILDKLYLKILIIDKGSILSSALKILNTYNVSLLKKLQGKKMD